jgi:hypothetical protein
VKANNYATVYRRLQRVCETLNAEAYVKNPGKTRFHPCEKADVLIESIRDKVPMTIALDRAATVYCHCHGYMGFDALLDVALGE